jgi:hypothetical protein
MSLYGEDEMGTISGMPDHSRSARNGNGNSRRHSPREHLRNGMCLAALRGFTAAKLYRAPENELTLGEAALRCGSCLHYVQAALVLFEHADPALIDRVIRGKVNILTAAESVKAEVKLTAAFRAASPQVRIAAAAKIGVDVLWDGMIEPLIGD